MDICHTGPLKVLINYPDLVSRFGNIIIQKEVAEMADSRTIQKFKSLVRSKDKTVILWSRDKKQRNDLVPLMTKINAYKVILPASTVEEVKQIEQEKPQTKFFPVISITSQTRQDFIKVLNYILNSKVIVGIGLDIENVLKPYSHLSINTANIRPRLLKNINELFGLGLYHKSIYCLGSLYNRTSLQEIYQLNQLKLVHTLVTDAVFIKALQGRTMENDVTYKEFDRNKRMNFSPEELNLELIKENIRQMEKYNEGK